MIAGIDSFPLSLLVNSTVIFVAGAATAGVLRDKSAALRKSVWALTLAAAASLPIGMIATPAWRLRILPAATAPLGQSDAVASIPTSIETRVSQAPVAVNAPGPISLPVVAAKVATELEKNGTDILRIVALIWMAGVALVIARMFFGVVALGRVTRRAVPASGEGWAFVIEAERNRAGISREVRVLVSGDVSTPLTFGIVSPLIILPEESASWTNEHRSVVIRHEMAHVASGDIPLCFVAGLACAFYWFHPMAWVASNRLRREQERACDDRVLALGTPATDYATHLLEVARSAREMGMPGFVSVAMARPTQLEGRLLAVLDDAGRRESVTNRDRLIGYSLTALAVLVLSAFRLDVRGAETPASAISTRVPSNPARGSGPALTQAMMVPTAQVVKPREYADSTVTSYADATPGGTLVLDLKTGSGITIVGTDEQRVRMRAFLSGRDWRNTKVSFAAEEGGARVETYYMDRGGNQSSSHRMEFSVPRRFNVRINSAGGGITIRNVSGNFSGSTGGGDIKIDAASGTARLSTGGGSVVVTNSNLDGTVATGGGSVLIQGVTGSLRGSSGTGDVLYGKDGLTFSDEKTSGGARRGSDGKLYLNKSGGGVAMETVTNGANISTGGGGISIVSADGDLRANTGGGDISVGSLRGSGTLTTGAGDVNVTVAGPGTHSVKVSSGNGKIIITLPPDISASLDIETGYTREHGATRIDSDWSLPITRTTEWDSSQGSPRRYVRAIGTIGGGRGLIRVRTTNGDVVIRRSRQE